MERANKEIEVLRKQYEAMSQELKEATQEAEVAKCRRDWAFQERDKIVAERESIRSVCRGAHIQGRAGGCGSHLCCPPPGLCVIICGGNGTGLSATWPTRCVIWTT